jgi:hypothetical protein
VLVSLCLLALLGLVPISPAVQEGAEEWWRGVYWWKAFSDGREADRSDRSFNILGRPAGEAIATGFRRLAEAETGSR